jgi:hypothetical protein
MLIKSLNFNSKPTNESLKHETLLTDGCDVMDGWMDVIRVYHGFFNHS